MGTKKQSARAGQAAKGSGSPPQSKPSHQTKKAKENENIETLEAAKVSPIIHQRTMKGCLKLTHSPKVQKTYASARNILCERAMGDT